MRSLDEISALLFATEPMIFFGIGFLASALIATAIFPLVHNRATRLTTRRVMASMPQSILELVAEKDSMRAMFAIAVTRLENKIDELVEKVEAAAAQLRHQRMVSEKLKGALDEKSKLVAAMEVREGALMAREDSLVQELLALRDERHRSRSQALHDARQKNRDSGPFDSARLE